MRRQAGCGVLMNDPALTTEALLALSRSRSCQAVVTLISAPLSRLERPCAH